MYQVAQHCFADKADADNYLLSQIVPVITSDGRILKPEYQQGQWTFNGQVLNPTYPPCDIMSRVQEGAFFASFLIPVLVVAFGFRFMKSFIDRMNNFEPKDS